MELREKVADAIIEAGERYFSDPHELGYRPAVLAVADAILDIPEIKEALANYGKYRTFIEEIACSCIPDYEEAKRDAQALCQ